jgi:hypothetical protein
VLRAGAVLTDLPLRLVILSAPLSTIGQKGARIGISLRESCIQTQLVGIKNSGRARPRLLFHLLRPALY